jgi:pyrroline-5-carboxylate reductase
MAESSVGRIAILGGGVMGETLLKTLVAAGQKPGSITVAEKSTERAEALRATHGVEVTDSRSAVTDADIVFIVVKPQDVSDLLAEIADVLRPGGILASFAAGVRIERIESAVAAGTPVIRIMPNTPAVVGEGMFGASPGAACSDEHLAVLGGLLAAGGRFLVVEEKHQDALTAVSGSGPAYVFYLAEAMIAGGVEAGLDAESARELTTQTILGAAKLLAESDEDAAELRRRVTSPNGTTAAAIAVFDDRDVKDAIADGVVAAARRSTELSGG